MYICKYTRGRKERERERDMHICVYIFIYIYMYGVAMTPQTLTSIPKNTHIQDELQGWARQLTTNNDKTHGNNNQMKSQFPDHAFN